MRTTPMRNSIGPRSRAGYTFVEAAFTVGLLAIIIQVLVSTTLAMLRSGEFGHEHLQIIAAADDTLEGLGAELQFTSAGTDPVTNQPYVDITGIAGDEKLTFRRVADFGSNGAEVVQLWSTPIEYHLVNGDLVRTQDGVSTVIQRRVSYLDFEVDKLGRIKVQVTVTGKDPDQPPETRVKTIPTL